MPNFIIVDDNKSIKTAAILISAERPFRYMMEKQILDQNLLTPKVLLFQGKDLILSTVHFPAYCCT